ncbi:MAG: hypothetical protein RI940_459, partial [Bacteroidota bacterium]
MKNLLKYILLLFMLTYIVNPMHAQKRSKKGKKKSIVKKSPSKTKKSKQKTKKKKSNSNLNNNRNNTYKIPVLESEAIIEEPKTTKLDTIPEKVVTIMSAFKPQLKNVAKIGFLNASVQNDTTTLIVEYNVPSQNLSFQYKPISLIPRSYKVDSQLYIKNNGNIKAGYGNYFQHILNLNYNLIDNYKNVHAISVYSEAVKGLHHLQNQNMYGLNYVGDINFDDHNRVSTQVYFKQNDNYRYGLVPDSSVIPKSNFKQAFTHYGISLAFNNDQTISSKLKFKPILKFEHFDGITNASNNYVEFYNSFSYSFKNGMNVNFNILYNLNQYTNSTKTSFTNSILRFEPSLQLNKYNSLFNVGVSPTFENGKYH